MTRSPILSRKVVLLAFVALCIRLFALSPSLVERAYSNGLYPYIGGTLRGLLGPLPFSLGDVLYAAAVVWLLYGMVRFVRRWRAGAPRRALLAGAMGQTIKVLLAVYIVFQPLWGLNYSRLGIAHQLGLEEKGVHTAELVQLADCLQQRLVQTAPLVDTVARERLHHMGYLEKEALAAYDAAKIKLPFLAYRRPSIKPSLYSAVGHLFGFTGYYNPFTGEAQLKTSLPVFLKPFVLTHEMAHQLGYAKESEANFVSFLTGRQSVNPEVRYSVYFEMYLYTLASLRRTDSVAAKVFREAVPPRVKRDMQILAEHLEKTRNPVEPYISKIYGAYLRRNNQPKGTLSYNEVVVWLVAYGRRYGLDAL